jgi:hypothetical protein
MGSTAISSMKRAARAGAIAKRARRRRRLRRRDDALGVKWCVQVEPLDDVRRVLRRARRRSATRAGAIALRERDAGDAYSDGDGAFDVKWRGWVGSDGDGATLARVDLVDVHGELGVRDASGVTARAQRRASCGTAGATRARAQRRHALHAA